MLCWGSTRIGQEAFCWLHSCLRVLPFPPRRARRLHRVSCFPNGQWLHTRPLPQNSSPRMAAGPSSPARSLSQPFVPLRSRSSGHTGAAATHEHPWGVTGFAHPTRPHPHRRLGQQGAREGLRRSGTVAPAPSDGLASLLVVRLPIFLSIGCLLRRSRLLGWPK